MLMSCTVKIAASMAIRCAGEVQGKQRRAEATLQKPAVAAAGIKCCDNCIAVKGWPFLLSPFFSPFFVCAICLLSQRNVSDGAAECGKQIGGRA